MTDPTPTFNPVTHLQASLRDLEDRRDALTMRARALQAEAGDIAGELRQLRTAIAATRGLLALADAATRPTDEPAEPTKTPTTTTSRKKTPKT